MTNLALIAVVLGGLYFLLMLTIAVGLYLTRQRQPAPQILSASIVVCARNEASIISNLLQSLTALIYPLDKFEVILVDDDSTDDTLPIMRRFATGRHNWKVLHHTKTGTAPRGKKGALTLGIRESCGDVILVTDADCRVPPNWLASMVSHFQPNIGVVLGHSPVAQRPGGLNLYERFDTLCEAALAAATTYFNQPSHANGRNLAYRRCVFEEIGGFQANDHIDTGDDFFLVQQIRVKTPWRFVYNTAPESYVVTEPIGLNQKYLRQQLRRNSKAFHLTLPFFCMGAVIFLFHLGLAFMLCFPALRSTLITLLGLKFIFEFIPTYRATQLFGQSDLLKYFPLFWIIYPGIYLLSQLVGSLRLYRWK